MLGITLTHGQDLACGLVELHEVYTGPPPEPVKVPLDGIPSIQCADCPTQCGVIGKPAEGTLNPTVHVAHKEVKQHWSQLFIMTLIYISFPFLVNYLLALKTTC